MIGTRLYAGSEISYHIVRLYTYTSVICRNLKSVTLHNCETSIEHTKFWLAAVSVPKLAHEDSSTDIQIAGIPNVYYFGQECLHNILVIDLLGPSLEDLFNKCNRRFSTKTVVMVAKQMVSQFATISNQYFMLIIRSSREFKQSTKRTSSTVTSSLTTSSLVLLDPKSPMSSMWWILAWASNIGIPKRSNISHIVSGNHFLALQDI